MKQLLFTKGPQGPIGATLGTAMNNFCSSSNKVSTHYITWLFSFWIWRRRCLKFAWFWPFGALPLGPHGGHTYYLNNFESPTPKDDSLPFLVKIQLCIFKKMKQLLLTKGPQGPIGATLGTAMNNFCSSSNKVSTHYITWLFSFWIWRRRCLKFAWFWPFGALPLGPHGGHTYYLNNFESPTPKDDSCQVWLKSNHAFSRRRWKCKKFTDDGRRTTDDARRTTDDGRKRTAIAHSSLRLRWAKNACWAVICCPICVTNVSYERKIIVLPFPVISFVILIFVSQIFEIKSGFPFYWLTLYMYTVQKMKFNLS